jgi:BTB/POZ domain
MSTVPELTSNPASEETKRLVWKSYATDMSHLFSDYMKGGSLVDTTLIAGGQKIRVHKMVLSACSSFLKVIVVNFPTKALLFPTILPSYL